MYFILFSSFPPNFNCIHTTLLLTSKQNTYDVSSNKLMPYYLSALYGYAHWI